MTSDHIQMLKPLIENESRKLRFTVVGCVVFVIVISLFTLRLIIISDDIRRNREIGFGKIVHVNTVSNQLTKEYVVYYTLQGFVESFNGSITIRNLKKQCKDELNGRSFPVIYSTENPKHNKMLITPKDFEAYGLGYPDSLKKFWFQCRDQRFE